MGVSDHPTVRLNYIYTRYEHASFTWIMTSDYRSLHLHQVLISVLVILILPNE